jgi:hypothetical protein
LNISPISKTVIKWEREDKVLTEFDQNAIANMTAALEYVCKLLVLLLLLRAGMSASLARPRGCGGRCIGRQSASRRIGLAASNMAGDVRLSREKSVLRAEAHKAFRYRRTADRDGLCPRFDSPFHHSLYSSIPKPIAGDFDALGIFR